MKGGSHGWIVISMALCLVLSFAVGVTAFRQSRAIWTMTSPASIEVNNTLNTITEIEPLLIIIIIVGILLLIPIFTRAYGGGTN